MTDTVAYRITINGVVQAVGFRPFVYRIATDNDLLGWVKNLGDAGVAIFVQGKKADIEKFTDDLQGKNPPLARIEEINRKKAELDDSLSDFTIVKSSSGSSGSGTIPPDIATCNECLDDVFGNSRYSNYWATSCVNCGPRFSVIRELPYDRDKTSMDEFPMCDDCRKEYTDPKDRRYHAQTIACPDCGPLLWYETPDSEERKTSNPIEIAISELTRGKILAIKGLGGTHLACNAANGAVVSKLRNKLGRPSQPFALMATESMVKENLKYTEEELGLLTGPRRPIELLEVKKESWVSEKVAPGLHNLGVMLPYTALHHLIFEGLTFPLVMTSANIPGEPMLIRNESIRSNLTQIVDGYLLHDRSVVSRIDDSVVRYSDGHRKFIRRSRGWVPEPLEVDLKDKPLLALGAEQDNVIGLYKNGKVYLSQYLGDTDGPKDLDFLEEALRRLLKLTNTDLPEVIAHDMHPGFLTTQMANDLREQTVPVQHHKAHVGALLAEHDLAEVVGIIMDGLGYGEDGKIWGGEVIKGSSDGLERVGSLSPAYMPGGDLATRHPARMVAGILYPLVERGDIDDFETLIGDLDLEFPEGKEEMDITIEQLQRGINSPVTTSSGRFLDGVSALLGICGERSYEGEPAMKLESAALEGEVVEIELPTVKQAGFSTLDQSKILRRLLELRKDHSPADLAATAQWALAKGLSKLALDDASREGIDNIGFSGGVAYNGQISRVIESTVTEAGLNFFTNEEVPVGDGGIAFGQLWVAAMRERMPEGDGG